MRISKIQNSSFGHSGRNPSPAQPTNNHKPQAATAAPIANDRQLVSLQPTEYKQFNSEKQFTYNPFLAQYIDQSNSVRSRQYIGSKPAWQAKKQYENADKIQQNNQISQLNISI